jgi:hypothetical protein
LKKGCLSNSFAVDLFLGSFLRQHCRKLVHSGLIFLGKGGTYLDMIKSNIFMVSFVMETQGGLPVSISINVQPKLQISAAKSAPV